MGPAPIRAFVALPLPEPPRRELDGYLAACAAAAPAYRWVPPENLHLTLRFLGNRPEAALAALDRRLGAIESPSFELALGGLGSFGGRSPRVLWLGLDRGGAEAGRLAAAVEAACREAGIEAEERPFRAHLTLARARDREAGEVPALPAAPAIPPWTADRFVLFRSRLGGGPARYTELGSYPLL